MGSLHQIPLLKCSSAVFISGGGLDRSETLTSFYQRILFLCLQQMTPDIDVINRYTRFIFFFFTQGALISFLWQIACPPVLKKL